MSSSLSVSSSRVTKLSRLGTRRLTRAHVALGERPQVSRMGQQALQVVCESLGRELGCAVSAVSRLAEAGVVPVKGLSHTAAFVFLDLSASGGSAVLELEPPVLFAALERLAGGAARQGPMTRLTRLEEASIAYLVLAALVAFRSQGELQRRWGPRLVGVTVSRTDALARLEGRRAHVGVELSLTLGQCTAGARLVIPAGVVESTYRDLPVQREASCAPEVLAASLRARCFLGSRLLLPSELGTLAVGDVVVFEGARLAGESLLGRGRLVTRGFELVGEFSTEGFSLMRARTRALSLEADMVAVTERSEGMPPLPVEVEIELTRLLLPLSELATLRPGQLLPLHIHVSEPVVLRVGDRGVARAELVDIDGEIGARILSLLP
ncbi:type III secretion system cytoplasmic ring protein SctQ [Stigmatella sp. ncwal1]|uniref:Flagellar motor switch protein FliM n=1 Tax=Stigmatella ashevillensis TaxID=2995309 RepID=A0ABT5D957_9BACT|nr:type III secretion system cytoplasmic ring protein SctQ [Stigmatella ashevillena]MDC0709663.1 type III secretion system cytoplasmic ring protein SctQ [Stigmatella ashevillena]